MDAQVRHDAIIDEDQATDVLADRLLDYLTVISRHLALLAATIATAGSLFLSEVIGWPPCVLCWYQRILMYPLVVILAVGIWRRDRGLHLYALPLSLLGAGTSLYHYLLIKTDWFPPPPCATGISCTVDYIDWFGFINIPFLALTAFLIVTCAMLTWALLGQPESDMDAMVHADERMAPALDNARLAVLMIITSVALSYLVGSSLI